MSAGSVSSGSVSAGSVSAGSVSSGSVSAGSVSAGSVLNEVSPGVVSLSPLPQETIKPNERIMATHKSINFFICFLLKSDL